MDIDLNKEGRDSNGSFRWASSRRAPYKYSIDSWTKWGKKHNIEVFVLNEELVPHDYMGLCWQRYYLFDILESNNVEYDQVLMVDADTIVHPECPNFFKKTEHKLVGVHNEGSYDWVLRSMENYSKHIFEDYMSKWWEYIDCGFIIANETHKEFFKKIIDYYNNNAQTFKELEKLNVGTDQTPVNLLIGKENIDLKLFPYEYNMVDMTRKELLGEDLLFTKCGWVYQYNCLPNNEDNQAQYYWMKKTYEYFYN